MPTKRELKKFLRVAESAAHKAAKIQKKNYGKQHNHNMKLGHDFATDTDIESEKIILETLQKSFPEHAYVAEESKNAEKDLKAEYCWVIDPLDGTHCFANQIPYFAPSIALLYKGEPIVGVIDFPILKEKFTAIKGEGTKLNGKEIKVFNTSKFEGCQLVSGHSLSRSKKVSREIYTHFGSTFTIPAAVEVMRRFVKSMVPVSPGHLTHKVWDIAATVLIAEEAGGKPTDWRGRKLKLDKIMPLVGICYSTSRNHKKFISLMKKYVSK